MENVWESWNEMEISCSEQMVAMKSLKFNEPRVAFYLCQAQEGDNQMPITGSILIVCFLI